MSGWISLDRAITKHWLWQNEKFTKGQAWIDLLLWAAHTPNKQLIKGTLIPVARGEQIRSQLTLAKTWNWDRKTVSRFLKLLEKDGMIVSRVDHLTSYVSICNYDSFQCNTKDSDHLKGQLKGQQAPSREDTNNKGNKEKNENNKHISDSRFDEFYDLYDKKVGGKKVKAKFDSLSKTKIDKIFEVVSDYVLSTPNKQYRKAPLVWLNGEHWNDEIQKSLTFDCGIDFDAIATNFNKSMSIWQHVPEVTKVTEKQKAMISILVSDHAMTNERFEKYFHFCATGGKHDYFLDNVKTQALGLTYFLSEDTIQK
jgi:hypothetical protein